MLTQKRENFVQNLIIGMTQRQAYYKAFPSSEKWKPETVDSKASELLKNDKVLARYKELQAKAEDEAIITSIEMQKMYTEILKGEKKFKDYTFTKDGELIEREVPIKASDWNKTSELLMKLQGAYIDKVEVKDNRENSKLDKILEQLSEES